VLLYLHGLNSSPQSFKARLLHSHMVTLGRGGEFICPALPHSPRAAIAMVESLLASQPLQEVTLVGSSLGGYYATCLAQRHGLRAVLINPAVRPYELLQSLLGAQENLYSGERYDLTLEHLDELLEMEVSRIDPAQYLLMVCTADEVLDYRAAVARYHGCRQIVIEGGDHGFSDFAAHARTVLEFAGLSS